MKAKPAGRFYRFCSNNGPFVVFGKMLGESRRQKEKGANKERKEGAKAYVLEKEEKKTRTL